MTDWTGNAANARAPGTPCLPTPSSSLQALIDYSIAEVEATVSMGYAFASGGTGDVFRGFLRGVPVAIKRVL